MRQKSEAAMNVLLIGQFGEDTQARIRAAFSADWRLEIAAPEEAAQFLAEAEAVIPEHIPVDEAFLAQAVRLRMVQTGAGYDNVDLAACTRHGVQVCNAAGVNAAAVAEHVMAFLLAYYKDLCLLNTAMHAGETAVPSYTGGELAGRTIGLVGLGRIGRAVAARCQAFGMRVIAWSYRPIEVPGVTLVDLPALYRESDIVSLHVPLKPETRAMIDARALAQMKPGALLVNTARGGLVDEAALVDALAGGQLGGACLDVFAEEPLAAGSPLRRMANVILTPHTAGYPDGVKFHVARYAFFVENIRSFFAGQTPACRCNHIER